MKNRLRCILILILLLALPLPASALCVLCSCTASATGVSFGSYNPFGSNVDAADNIHLACTNGPLGGALSYSIALNKGLYSVSFDPRQMGNGANRLNYNLYTDSGRTTIWDDGTGVVTGSISIPFLLGGSGSADKTVYGRIPGSQTTVVPAVSSYSDTITVTVTYQ